MGNVSKRNKKVKQGNRQLLKILMPKKKQKETVEKKPGGPGKDPGKAALVRVCTKRNDHKLEI